MASIFSRALASQRALTGVTAIGAVGGAYYLSSQRPHLLDSAENAPSKTLSFPSSMLFSKQLKVIKTEQINHDTKKITFELPGGMNEVSGVTPGNAILTQHTPTGAWFPVLRPYTPIHDLDERGILQLLVKRYPNGKASSHMHALQPGQELTVRGPIPGYTYKPAPSSKDIILVAGGAGITPIYSLTKGILINPDDKTRIQLLWGVNGTRDIVLKEQLEALEQQHPDRLRVRYAVSGPEAKPEAPSLGPEERYKKGYVDGSMLEEAIARCKQGSWGDEKGTKVFLCGPPSMEDAIAGKQGVLGQLGVTKKEINRF